MKRLFLVLALFLFTHSTTILSNSFHKPYKKLKRNSPVKKLKKNSAVKKLSIKNTKTIFNIYKTIGGWEGSGGDGVACFASPEFVKLAKEEIKNQGFLSLGLKKEIISLVTLDYWDFADKIEIEDEYISYDNFIKSINHDLNNRVPLFYKKFKALQYAMSFEKINWQPFVPQINDSQAKKEIKNNCIIVQIAARFSKYNNLKQPYLYLHIDQFLYQALSPMNQGLLMLHEWLYAFGREAGHVNSNKIRKLVMLIASGSSIDLQGLLMSYYGNYTSLFPDLDFEYKSDYEREVDFFDKDKAYLEMQRILNEETTITPSSKDKK